MRYRTLDVRIWCDQKFRALSPIKPSGQALFLYLLTNPNTNVIPGLYRAGAAAMAEELGWSLEGFQKAFQEVLNQGLVKADFQARVIFIPNAIKYNKPQSPNVVKSWASHWDEIPECALKDFAYQALKAFTEELGEAFANAFDKAIGKTTLNQEQEQEQDHEQETNINKAEALPFSNEKISTSNEVVEIFKHWQQVMNHPHAKLDAKRAGQIKKALRLGYSLADLKQAITGCAQTPFNMGDNDRKQRYDDIALIFRDSSHIESFMQQASADIPAILPSKSNLDIFGGAI